MLRLDTESAGPFLELHAREELQPALEKAHRAVLEKTGAGSEFLGWRDLLREPNDALLEDITFTAAQIRERADVFLCIGIGGSYLGSKAVIEALSPYYGRSKPEILFAGHHMSGAYIRDLLSYLDGKSVYVNVISKSGTTLEPALAFRFIRSWMEERFDDAEARIIVTTDPEKGALNELREEKGYKKYVIPPDVGGRFSVLTPVGLLPIAVAGIDVRSLFYGSVEGLERYGKPENNAALEYTATRYLLYRQGFAVEAMAVFEPKLFPFVGWWQQLFGESEGKDRKGLFPVALQYSTDLHSVGQYMQDGERIMIETFLMPEHDAGNIPVPREEAGRDGLDYLAGTHMTDINRQAYAGTRKAHTDGGVPNMTLWMDRVTPATIGEAVYFFEHAVAVGGYLLGVNPFDQPGVEAYKNEMYALLESGNIKT